jgi:hypothetical protein
VTYGFGAPAYYNYGYQNYAYDEECYETRRVWTQAGWRLVQVFVCEE